MDYYLSRGLAFDKVSNFPKAEIDYKYYLKINPHSPEATYNFGLIEYHAEKYENAESLFSKVIQMEPKNRLAFFYRGVVRFKMGQKDEGCKDIETCKKLGYTAGYNKMKDNCKY